MWGGLPPLSPPGLPQSLKQRRLEAGDPWPARCRVFMCFLLAGVSWGSLDSREGILLPGRPGRPLLRAAGTTGAQGGGASGVCKGLRAVCSPCGSRVLAGCHQASSGAAHWDPTQTQARSIISSVRVWLRRTPSQLWLPRVCPAVGPQRSETDGGRHGVQQEPWALPQQGFDSLDGQGRDVRLLLWQGWVVTRGSRLWAIRRLGHSEGQGRPFISE